ncbi:MAG: metal-dependent hydrolase, partial [Candidatus Tectomicrobia bacterium]|nr:metal-dependent hydrolase [Candidatus Tectomicrobia bacterium]
MDLLTHAVLGAAGAAALARKPALWTAALAGGVAGVAPDADILIASSADPLLNLEFHRHFTHALVLGPVGALLIAGLVWLIVRRRTPYAPLYGYACIGYLLSPLLDACTSYGTHLLWPFAAQPIAWSIIAVIDPVFTSLVSVPLVVCLWRQQRGWAHLGVALAVCYVALGGLQHARAASA